MNDRLTARCSRRRWLRGCQAPLMRYRVHNPVRWGVHGGSAEGSSLVGVRWEAPVHGKAGREREGSFRVGCRVEDPARGEAAETVRGRKSCPFQGPNDPPFHGGCNGDVMPLAKMSGSVARGDRAHLAGNDKAHFSCEGPGIKTTGEAPTITQFFRTRHKKEGRNFGQGRRRQAKRERFY